VRLFLALEDRQGETQARPAHGGRIGHGYGNQPGALVLDHLSDETVIVGADDRYEFDAGRLVGIDDHAVDAGGPNAVDLLTGGQQVLDLLRAFVIRPAREHRGHHLDAGIRLQRLLEALVTVGVGGYAVDAALSTTSPLPPSALNSASAPSRP